MPFMSLFIDVIRNYIRIAAVLYGKIIWEAAYFQKYNSVLYLFRILPRQSVKILRECTRKERTSYKPMILLKE